MSLMAALWYGKRNWPVFPIGKDCRSPICEHGVYDASAEPGRISELWRGREDANVALACGAPSGVMVLDIDVKGEVDGLTALAALEDEHGQLPETPEQKTPSGGRHLFFLQPAGRELYNKVGLRRYGRDGTKTVFAGLDIRTSSADGLSRRGSVALTPSTKPNGAYTWLRPPTKMPLAAVPGWLLEIIDPPLPPRQPAKAFKISGSENAARWVAAAVNGECNELARMHANSGRNLRLFQAAANLGGIVATGLLPQATAEDALERAAADCGLAREDGPRQVRDTIASGMRRGLENPREVSF
jgi:hypothetical protein